MQASLTAVINPVHSPVIIGGLGGSGTRVVAELLAGQGWYLGRDLNAAMDNLLFSLFFKRPFWHRQVAGQMQEIAAALAIFDRLMAGARPVLREWRFILAAVRDALHHGHDYIGSRQGTLAYRIGSRSLWPFARLSKLFVPGTSPPGMPERWGWKEPNTHVYLEHLIRHYPRMKYIHVVRHGLDMAFSRNQAQLFNWGGFFDVAPPATSSASSPQLARSALDFWINANSRAIALGGNALGERFLLLNYDALCETPEPVIRALCVFLGVNADDREIERLTKIPRIPATTGRYLRQDLGIFAPEQLNAVRQMGFPV